MSDRPTIQPQLPQGKKRKIILKRSQMLPFKGTLDFLASRLPGGRNAFMDLIALAVEFEEGLAPIAQVWQDTVPTRRIGLSIDQICEAAAPRIGRARIAGLAMQAAMTWGVNVGNMIAALNHPRVVQASIDEALKADGAQDRRMQFLHSGFLPKEGGTFAPVINASAEAEAGVEVKSVTVNTPGLPPFEVETVERARLIRGEES